MPRKRQKKKETTAAEVAGKQGATEATGERRAAETTEAAEVAGEQHASEAAGEQEAAETTREQETTETTEAAETTDEQDAATLLAQAAAKSEAAENAPRPKRPQVANGDLVHVRLDGALRAVLGNLAVLRGEVYRVPYYVFKQANAAHPGKFKIKYPGASEYVTES